MKSFFSRLAQAMVLMSLFVFLAAGSAGAAPPNKPNVEIFVFPGTNMPRIGLDKILDDVELVSMDGDRTQRRDVFRGTWTNSPEQLLERIDGAISANTQWLPVRAEGGDHTSSVWVFTDKAGHDWKGMLEIGRDCSDPGKVLVTATVQRVLLV